MMPDREMVIKSLMELHGSEETMAIISDAVALLKEQEAKTVLYRKERSVNPGKALSGFCPKCSHTLIYGMNKHFCGNCGQEVKWE